MYIQIWKGGGRYSRVLEFSTYCILYDLGKTRKSSNIDPQTKKIGVYTHSVAPSFVKGYVPPKNGRKRYSVKIQACMDNTFKK
jgi:hypothetical protein